MTTIKLVEGEILTIQLPGLEAVRLDATTRTIAIDGISGMDDCVSADDWFITDLRDGTYGDFHRLTDRGNCNDEECRESGQHNAFYPHYHETIEDTSACEPCMNRAGTLRLLAEEFADH